MGRFGGKGGKEEVNNFILIKNVFKETKFYLQIHM